MSLLSMCPVCRNPESMRSDCMAFDDVSRRSCPKIKFKQHAEEIQALRERAEQAEARALEYKTEHAALLGTSQWQEVEIADLRDDVRRHMQIASECEERALAAEKDKKQLLTRLVDALESAVDWACYASEYFREKHGHAQDIEKLDAARDELAAVGAKHD